MLRITATFDVTILYFVAANILAILVYMLVREHRVRNTQRDLDKISAAIIDFFRRNDEQVEVECTQAPGKKRFVALIDSLPTKRSRHSHVLAVILANHVRKACGLELAKVYWRFPIKVGADEAPAPHAAAAIVPLTRSGDAYLDEGRRRLKELPRYEVTESSWEKFQELVGHKMAVP